MPKTTPSPKYLLGIAPRRSLSVALLVLTLASPAFAHVTIKPAQSGLAVSQIFTVTVPNERNLPTTAIRLVLPEGLSGVSPYVKSGWKVEIVREADGASTVKELRWTGGSVPEGFREEFAFSAKTPPQAGDLVWKAYQTYADGVTVAWDLPRDDPRLGGAHSGDLGPYSVTRVVDDLATAPSTVTGFSATSVFSPSLGFLLAVAALVLSLVSLVLVLVKRNKP